MENNLLRKELGANQYVCTIRPPHRGNVFIATSRWVPAPEEPRFINFGLLIQFTEIFFFVAVLGCSFIVGQ